MKQLSAGLCALAILLCISSLRPVQAQTTSGATRAVEPARYNPSEEVTITGVVSSVLTHAAPGMVVGSHLLLVTPAGPVDASLGRFGLRGNGALSAAAGRQVEAIGVIRTIKDKPVFLARTVKVGGEVCTIRNEHGVLMSPEARERAGLAAGTKGESR